jgi:hypothetical protein
VSSYAIIRDNLEKVVSVIGRASARSGRDPSAVTLIGVTKFADVPAINEAVRAGLLHIARLDLAGKKVTRHMIGHLQTNKVRDALLIFDLIHSIDSLKLVNEAQKRAADQGKVADILIQLDIAREETKFGLPEEELDNVLAQAEQCPNVCVRGLMTMAPLTEDFAAIRDVFRRCRRTFERVRGQHASSPRIRMEHLSMGMSHDYEIAVEEGATMVRVGSAIFNNEKTLDTRH